MMTHVVLVTGALGLVGTETVKRLVADGRQVVGIDLDTPTNRKKARKLPNGAEIWWADLTNDADVYRLVSDLEPAAIIHLAAVIPPGIYRNPALARRVNVDATATLVRAAEALPTRPRFVQASSNAVWGSRNPHRTGESIAACQPARPTDLYGAHKLEAEIIVRSSILDWVVLRLGGVISVDPKAMPFTNDALFFESCLPSDGRVHMVDVRDVATAFAAATTADVLGETLLIGGDDSHKLKQGDVGPTLAATRGMVDVLPVGRPGDPISDDDWFITEWMDTRRAQEALNFQHHSWQEMVEEMREAAGWTRRLVRFIAPLARAYVKRHDAYRNSEGSHAHPWGAIRVTLGEPGPDRDAYVTSIA
jgi:D-erythronate 2-dehydrogenase